MGNLGAYQLMTTLAKKAGGPKMLGLLVAAGGWGFGRLAEAGGKKGFQKFKETQTPCETKGRLFQATSAGVDRDLTIGVGDAYRVLECAGDAVLIDVLGDPDSPYMVSSEFLRSVSEFPSDNLDEND